MTESELKSMTVTQLRQFAKDREIALRSNMDKATVIETILSALNSEQPAEAPAEEAPSGPRFQAAWHNTDAPKYTARPVQPATGGFGPRTTWQQPTQPARPVPHETRPPVVRPATYPHRFGPAASVSAPSAPSAPEAPAAAAAESAPESVQRTPAASPLPERRISHPVMETGFSPRPSYTYTPRSAGDQQFSPINPQETGINAPTLEELLASGDYEEGGGILELHPDGYGFLRASHFLPSSKDVYISMAQIRRFGLRTGDHVTGKIRPQREGDKYAAMLYISEVNGVSEKDSFSRPFFDELTPVYSSRRISLESSDGKSLPDMRLIDLIAPIGFGQRALMLCPPNTGKQQILSHLAKIITANYPEAHVLMLLIDVIPEDVTQIREDVPCPVLASTFDQPPESHLRLSEMVLERAMRLVEQQKDVVLLADSLTKLAKIYTTAATQQGRSLPGMVNPASLFRAKKLFGAARACKEGGSLTVIAAMDIATGSKVDDSVVEEFKGTANMELMLDQAVASAGISPALNLQQSFTKNADILLDDRQKEGLTLIRSMLGSTPSSVAIPQLESMMEKADTNASLLLKIKDWYALMNR